MVKAINEVAIWEDLEAECPSGEVLPSLNQVEISEVEDSAQFYAGPAELPLIDELRAAGWNVEMAELIALAWTAELPAEPFPLLPGYNIFDPKLWYSELLEDINQGPGGIRSRLGILLRDLAALRAIVTRSAPEAKAESEWSADTAVLIRLTFQQGSGEVRRIPIAGRISGGHPIEWAD